MFIIAKVVEFTSFAPLFQSQNPIPVGIIPKYKIDNHCVVVKEKVVKFVLITASGKTKIAAAKYADVINCESCCSLPP